MLTLIPSGEDRRFVEAEKQWDRDGGERTSASESHGGLEGL
jgi:hypothetical protein